MTVISPISYYISTWTADCRGHIIIYDALPVLLPGMSCAKIKSANIPELSVNVNSKTESSSLPVKQTRPLPRPSLFACLSEQIWPGRLYNLGMNS